MSNDLQEAIADFLCSSADEEILADKINNVIEHLRKVQSRFIDLDPSVKLTQSEELDQFKDSLHRMGLRLNLINDLLEIHEVLCLHQALHAKWGEAADWYLKSEYEATFSSIFTRVLSEINTIKKTKSR